MTLSKVHIFKNVSKASNEPQSDTAVVQKITVFLINIHTFRLPKIKEFVDKNDPGAMIIPFSGAFEAKFLEMDEEARKAFCEETKCTR